MKKLLGIVVIFFLYSNILLALELPKDVVSGNKYEKSLTDTMIFGNGNIPGLSQIDKIKIIGGLDNPAREGLVSIYVDDIPSDEIVKKLNLKFNLSNSVHPTQNSYFNLIAPRPYNTSLNSSLFSETFNFRSQDWKKALNKTIELL